MIRKLLILSVLILTITACTQKTEIVDSIVIASWNVANLFNGQDDGNEYEEYTSQGHWTENQYRTRLKKIETVLNYEGLKDASIIVLNEVENESVLEDILRLGSVAKRGFCYYACCGEEDGAIKIGLISKMPIENAYIHAIEGQRPILEVDFNIDSTLLTVLAIHGKSNLGDQNEDALVRNTCGKVIESLCLQIKSARPLSTIVLAGDFNEEFSDGNIVQNTMFWDCFWNRSGLTVPGSYYYREQWKSYDNILIDKNGTWKTDQAGVVFYGILQSIDNTPDSWKRYLLSGVSDHLPVWIKIKR